MAQTDPHLRERILKLTGSDLAAELPALGQDSELTFTALEFDAAFKHDWRLRWLKQSARHRYLSSPAELEEPSAPSPW